MTDETNPDDFLMGSGVRSAAFKVAGAKCEGKVVGREVRQQTDFDSGAPLFWDDGKPRQQLVITLQTEESEDDDDDGLRKLYAKGNMLSAVRSAVAKAGERSLAVGGWLTVTYTGDGEKPKKGFAPKLYDAKWDAAPFPDADPDEPSAEPF